MADFKLTSEEKEKSKLQYSDLAPSLQEIIDGKVDLSALQALERRLDAYSTFMNGMKLTIGTSYPSNPVNNKNVHLNLSNRVLYIYTSSAWKPAVMIPQS